MTAPRIESVKGMEGSFALHDFNPDDGITIACGAFQITIKRNDVGISIDVYGQNTEEQPVASLTAWDEDVELDVE